MHIDMMKNNFLMEISINKDVNNNCTLTGGHMIMLYKTKLNIKSH